jgi:hypothetical protein
MWKMGNPPVLLHDRIRKFRYLQLVKVDERFIVLSDRTNLYFISTETFEEFRTLSLRYYEWRGKWHYDRGLLFQFFDKWKDDERSRVYIIRILDVASGTFFNDLCKNFWRVDLRYMNGLASTNSRFMVIGWQHYTGSRLNVYDLEAVKNPNADRRCYLLYTLRFEFHIPTFVMDESRIVFNRCNRKHWNVTVLNFADFLVEQKASDLEDKDETKIEIHRPPEDESSFR